MVEATIGKRRSFDKSVDYGCRRTAKAVSELPPVALYLKKHVRRCDGFFDGCVSHQWARWNREFEVLCWLQADSLMSVPLFVLLKSAAVLKEDEMTNAAAVAWEFLLQDDKETVACAGDLITARRYHKYNTIHYTTIQYNTIHKNHCDWALHAILKKLIFSHLFCIAFIFQKICGSLQKLQDGNFYSLHLFLNRLFRIYLSRIHFYLQYSIQYTAYCILYTVYRNSIQCTVYSIQYTVYSTVYCILYTIYVYSMWRSSNSKFEQFCVTAITSFKLITCSWRS